MDISSINWLATVGAALAGFVLGGIWYGPLFGRAWQAHTGLTDEDLSSRGSPAVIMPTAFVLALVQATVLALLLPASAGVVQASMYALVIGVAFVATALGINYLFSRRSMALFAIDAGYNVLQFTLMGAIIGGLS